MGLNKENVMVLMSVGLGFGSDLNHELFVMAWFEKGGKPVSVGQGKAGGREIGAVEVRLTDNSVILSGSGHKLELFHSDGEWTGRHNGAPVTGADIGFTGEWVQFRPYPEAFRWFEFVAGEVAV